MKLPNTFRFSALITLPALALAGVMLWAAHWQWERYLYKRQLIETYQAHSTTAALPFPVAPSLDTQFAELIHRKVKLRGRYDFSRQVIIMNRQHQTGAGYWLLTPFLPQGSENYIIVSRGFIPFEDSTPESWQKYSFAEEEEFSAVLQETVPHRSFLSPLHPPGTKRSEFERKWMYPDVQAIATQLPYPVLRTVFAQRLDYPPRGDFPAPDVTVRVPPSTHFGYMIEWCLLSFATLVVAFLIQAFPRQKRELSATNVFLSNTRKAAGLALVLGYSFIAPSLSSAVSDGTQVPEQAPIIEHLGEVVNLDLQFQDSEGATRSLKSLSLGKPLVIAPVYYECPMLCSLTQDGLASAINETVSKIKLGTDYAVASLSFNPQEKQEFARRKAERYRDLISRNSSARDWHFLRGNAENIKELMEQLGIGYSRDGKDYIHAAVLVVITPTGRISRYLYGIKYPNEVFATALDEAKRGTISALVERVLMYCFRYDHLQGRYTLEIMNALRVLCGLVFFSLAGVLLWLRWAE